MNRMDASGPAMDEDSVVGCADGFRQGFIEGWAWRPKRPADAVTVEVLVDGKLAAEATACMPRPDLATAGIGHGRYAFAIPIDIAAGSPPLLPVIVRVKDGPVLPGGEFEIATTAAARAQLAHKRSGAYLEQVFGPLAGAVPRERPAAAAEPPPKLNFVLYTARGGDVAGTLGMPEYSYFFVMQGFAAVLRRLGNVHAVHDPAQAETIHHECLAAGESCLLLSFAPPQGTTLGLRCPIVPVIAWEFPTLPTGEWSANPRENWPFVLRQTGRAITISDFAARAVRAGMGAAYPVVSIPTPVWDRLAGLRQKLRLPDAPQPGGPATLLLDGFVWDSHQADISPASPLPPLPPVSRRGSAQARAAAPPEPQPEPQPAPHEPPPEPQPAPPPPPPPPAKTARQRLGITVWLARQWYREAVRDALPRPVASAISTAGRVAYALRPPPPAIEPEPQATPADPALPATARYLPVGATDPSPARAPPRYIRACDAPALAEPALAVFDPDPYPDILAKVAAARAGQPEAAPPEPEAETRVAVTLTGVVFTAVLSPKDGRKNWQDLLSAFITALRDEPQAVFVLKVIGADPSFWWWEFHRLIQGMPAFACRVLVLSGYLDDENYQALIAASHFVVNASLAEGQCLPLVEFMSAGRPAIAPRHTAMLEYITPDNAVIVASAPEFCSWPHDPRNHLITTRHRIEYPSVCAAFSAAWRILHDDPARYAAMGQAAAASVRAYCADDVLGPALAAFLGLGDAAVRRAGWQPTPTVPAERLA
jgi:hypothetical protein